MVEHTRPNDVSNVVHHDAGWRRHRDVINMAAMTRDYQLAPCSHMKQVHAVSNLLIVDGVVTIEALRVLVLLADLTAHCIIGYWHDNVVCLSIRLSVTLCIVAKRHILQQKCINK